MKATEVFTPGKLPDVTYVDDHLKERARILHDALETGAAVISLSGPSKSGKTVFIEKNIGKDRLVQVTGAGITDADRLWDRVFDLIGTPVSKRTTSTRTFDGTVGGKIGGEAGVLVSASGELSASGKWGQSSAEQLDGAVDYLQLLDQRRDKPNLTTQVRELKAFAEASRTVVICLSQIGRDFTLTSRVCPSMQDVRLPNPADLSPFQKACFLQGGKMQLHLGNSTGSA